MNIVDSCFTAASNRIAVVHRRGGVNHEVSYQELQAEVARFANGLSNRGIEPGGWSAWTTWHPRSSSCRATWVLPLARPPVSPTLSI